jgi:hypothetical protein
VKRGFLFCDVHIGQRFVIAPDFTADEARPLLSGPMILISGNADEGSVAFNSATTEDWV